MSNSPPIVLDICDNPTFIRKGSDLTSSIYALVTNYKNALKDLVEGASSEIPDVKSAIALMLVLEDGYGVSSKALAVKSQIAQAAYLTQEIRDLSCIATNLIGNVTYKISIKDAKRYGLTG